jgi:hypothetical protein
MNRDRKIAQGAGRPVISVVVWMLCFTSVAAAQGEGEVKDVFQPKVSAPEAQMRGEAVPVTATLQGISMSSKASFAILNNEVYHEGESKMGIHIAQIRRKEVDIIINGVTQTLTTMPYSRHAGKMSDREQPPEEEVFKGGGDILADDEPASGEGGEDETYFA